ncbi:MAG: hypothetical protein H0T92_10270 [Pyrinomonadaceae bacterium]|nr:hypothetical protein [Pyrinomonadaceae bacterium]
MKKKILLDHCLDWRLERYLPGHKVVTALDMGWDKVKNGALLSLAEGESFEVFITADQNLQYQQNLSGRTISIIVLVTQRNVLASLIPLAPKVLLTLETIQPGELVEVSA